MFQHNSKYFTGSQEQKSEICKVMCLPRSKVLNMAVDYWEEGPSSPSDLKNFVFAVSAGLWRGFKNLPDLKKDLNKIAETIIERLVVLCKYDKDPFKFLHRGNLKAEIAEIIKEQVFRKTARKKRQYDNQLRLIHRNVYDADPRCITEIVKQKKIKYKQQSGNRKKSRTRKEQVFDLAIQLFEKFRNLPSLKKIQAFCSCGQKLAKQAQDYLIEKFMRNTAELKQEWQYNATVVTIEAKYKYICDLTIKTNKILKESISKHLNLNRTWTLDASKASSLQEQNEFLIDKKIAELPARDSQQPARKQKWTDDQLFSKEELEFMRRCETPKVHISSENFKESEAYKKDLIAGVMSLEQVWKDTPDAFIRKCPTCHTDHYQIHNYMHHIATEHFDGSSKNNENTPTFENEYVRLKSKISYLWKRDFSSNFKK